MHKICRRLVSMDLTYREPSSIRRVLENTSRSCVSAVSCEVRSSQLATRSVHIELYS